MFPILALNAASIHAALFIPYIYLLNTAERCLIHVKGMCGQGNQKGNSMYVQSTHIQTRLSPPESSQSALPYSFV